MPPASTEVLIVGAGPTGLAVAVTLARAGVDFVLVDKLDQGQNTSRAAVIHAHTLDVLDEIGVAEPLAANGLKIAKFAIRDRDRVLIQTRFDTLPSQHPFLLMLPQDETEKIVADCLAKGGRKVHRGCRVDEVTQAGDGVRATISSEAGQQHMAARYVVGADGMHSIVRDAANIAFTGQAYEDSFILADVAMEWGHGRDEVTLFFSPAGLSWSHRFPTELSGSSRLPLTHPSTRTSRTSRPCSTHAAQRAEPRRSARWSGAHASDCITDSPTLIAMAGCCWSATQPMFTAPPAVKA